MNATPHRRWLMQLTSLPTAAGREQRVTDWIARWAAARKDCNLSRDRFGNLLIRRLIHGGRVDPGVKTPSGPARAVPIFLTAHLDHPAFVVTAVTAGRDVIADFRGGVDNAYFMGSRIVLHHAGAAPRVGRIVELQPAAGGKSLDKSVTVRFARAVRAEPGDVMTWNLPKTRITGDRVLAPACDDLAGVAAALAAFDAVYSQPRRPRRASFGGGRAPRTVRLNEMPDVRLLFTRCEEVGFIGAIAACKAGTIPKNALVIALENSKSFAESPIGAGPIVRVGDRTSTFDPDLTYRVGKVAEALAAEDKTFQWQRKLMPGGTCEASAYQTYGHTATCVCLPLGNYHNMNETKKKIDSEIVSARDFDNLVKLLAALGRRLGDPDLAPPLKSRLDALFKSRANLLR